MISQKIRRQFLRYFESKGHTLLPSSPVIPHEDPTLLFTNAGMNQFKDVFLGTSKRPYSRAATSQKCVRAGGKHNDLENVGHTSRHLTFFEMLGNFSFGDYFKKEAIDFAWEVSSEVFQLDTDRIWASVYEEDDEAFALWEKYLPVSRIVRFGEKENFWSMGETGPCGPCSELLFDRGEAFGKALHPHQDSSGERFFEFWNLVFMQYNREGKGVLEPLPRPSIDTGAGLERVVSLAMGVSTLFETDILRSLISKVEEISGLVYEGTSKLAPAFRVIADHIRTLAFAIADGAQPSNVDRGYVLRKILRRAIRYGRMLNLQKPFLGELLPTLLEQMGSDYPELKQAKKRTEEILFAEEENFLRTLRRGGQLLTQVMERSTATQKISGIDAFTLKDTYGLPIDEITLMAKDEGFEVDLSQFDKLEEEAREKSRRARKTEAQKFGENFFQKFTETHPACTFEGYHATAVEAQITSMVAQGHFVESLQEGDEAMILVDHTPFYAEMGGQVGDQGVIQHGSMLFRVEDCIAPYPGIIAHIGRLEKGELHLGSRVELKVDPKRREEIQNNHTATHLLHWALRQVVGSHVKQAGSHVDEQRLRFDFHHHKAVTLEELHRIEKLINERIRTNQPVDIYELPFQEAQKRGEIIQFFGEKYGEKVRVVDIDFSKELCGGTHVTSLGSIGFFKIAKESSIAAGIRRIEAVTGRYAEELADQTENRLRTLGELLKCGSIEVVAKVQQMLEEHKAQGHAIAEMRKKERQILRKELLNKQEQAASIHAIVQEVAMASEELASFAEELMTDLQSGVVVLGLKSGERCQLLARVSSDLVAKGLHAQELIKQVSSLIQGGGGGKPHLAQAGGKAPAGLSQALMTLRQTLLQWH